MEKKYSKVVKLRMFRIWQKLGHNPFKKKVHLPLATCPECGNEFDSPFCPECGTPHSTKSSSSEFFKGAFSSIPFLNSEAKKTFTHLMLRPGYMIMDYLRGKHGRYLAPMTALIIYYAFFALVSSIVSPEYKVIDTVIDDEIMQDNQVYQKDEDILFEADDNITIDDIFDNASDPTTEKINKSVFNVLLTARKMILLFSLDEHPEEVNTPLKASIATIEGTLRSQGLFKFLIQLIFLTLALWTVFRKRYSFTFSASATTASYILCQMCFLMLFALIITLGKSSSLGLLILITVMSIDFHQMFGLSIRQGIRATLITGIWYGVYYALSLILLAGIMVLITFLSGNLKF